MNKNEKQAVLLILFLFASGFAARFVSWTLPEIGESPVFVPTGILVNENLQKQEVQKDALKDSVVENFAKTESHSEKPKKKKPAKVKYKLPIAINSASLDALCAIPGVGPKLAEKILEYRKAKGPLKNEADLKKVPGIGDKKSKNILPSVFFD